MCYLAAVTYFVYLKYIILYALVHACLGPWNNWDHQDHKFDLF